MAARVRLTIIGLGTAFLAILTLWLLVGAPGATTPQEPLSSAGYAGAIKPEIPVQPLSGLRDQDGRPAKLPSEVTVLTFLYTTCEDACPTAAQQVRGALDRLEDPPPTLAISVDPRGDSERSARGFLADQGLTGRMRFLLGSEAALQRQWSMYGVQPQLEDADHSAIVVLLDPQGRQRIGFPLSKLTPEALAGDIERLRAATS